MVGFAHTLRGDGLVRVHRTLQELEADPSRLDCTRLRFTQSPPPYPSSPSGTRTLSVSPEVLSDEQRLKRERLFRLIAERRASLPREQFVAQFREERRRIWNEHQRTSRTGELPPPERGSSNKNAVEAVKKLWIEQGIWKKEMEAGRHMSVGRWKHEEPLEFESELETGTEAESPPPHSSFGLSQRKNYRQPRRPRSDKETKLIAARRVVRGREREASRPYHQFVFQISKEREQIQDEPAVGGGAGMGGADINTRAYENVKDTWTNRKIWNERWGILPGMLWKHEEPLEEQAADDSAPVIANPLVNKSPDVGEAPTRGTLESTSPVESNHRQLSGVMDASQQRLFTDIVSAGLKNDDDERFLSASKYPRFRKRKRDLYPTRRQRLRPSLRISSQNERQSQTVARTPLGPIHPSKVSKSTRQKLLEPQWRPRPPRRVNFVSLLSSPAVDAPEIQPSAHNMITGKGAKPQGILKGQPAKAARVKTRK